jgi:hypothetical protein
MEHTSDWASGNPPTGPLVEPYNPWGTAVSFISGKARPVPDAGEVLEAQGWKVARLKDPFTATFAGYAFGDYGLTQRAECLRSRRCPEAPGLGCDCGFNAMKEMSDARRLLERWRGFVLLEVELYGRLIEHRDGWRAEEQDVVRVHVSGRCARGVCRRPTAGFSPRRKAWFPSCAEHLGPRGVDTGLLRRSAVDVVIDPL